MNWNEIKEKYPKGFKLLSEYNKQFRYENGSWYDINGIGFDYYIERDLFSFFDEQGIHIMIDRDYDFADECYSDVWENDITDLKTNKRYIDNKFYDSRTLAEEQAFLKAFGILED